MFHVDCVELELKQYSLDIYLFASDASDILIILPSVTGIMLMRLKLYSRYYDELGS